MICPNCGKALNTFKNEVKEDEYGLICGKCGKHFKYLGTIQMHWSFPKEMIFCKMEELPDYIKFYKSDQSFKECYRKWLEERSITEDLIR